MLSLQSPAPVLSPATPVWSAQHGIWSMAEKGQNWSDPGACCFFYLQCVEWKGVIQVPVTSPLFSVWNGMERYRCLLLHLSSVCGMEWSDTDACCLTFLQCVEQNGVIQVPVASPLYKHISSMHIYNIHNNQPQNTPT